MLGIKLANMVSVQRSHDADSRHHGRPVMIDDSKHRFNRGLPLVELLFGLGKLLDIFGSVLRGGDLAAAGKRDRILEPSFPTAISRHAVA